MGLKTSSIFPIANVTQAQLTEQLANGPGLSYTSATFNLVGGTTVLIGTLESGYGRFRPMHSAVTCVAVEDYSGNAVISIGTNAPDYDNIVASLTLTDLNTVNKFLQGIVTGVLTVAPGSAIYAKLVTPSASTVLTAFVEVEGSYQGA